MKKIISTFLTLLIVFSQTISYSLAERYVTKDGVPIRNVNAYMLEGGTVYIIYPEEIEPFPKEMVFDYNTSVEMPDDLSIQRELSSSHYKPTIQLDSTQERAIRDSISSLFGHNQVKYTSEELRDNAERRNTAINVDRINQNINQNSQSLINYARKIEEFTKNVRRNDRRVSQIISKIRDIKSSPFSDTKKSALLGIQRIKLDTKIYDGPNKDKFNLVRSKYWAVEQIHFQSKKSYVFADMGARGYRAAQEAHSSGQHNEASTALEVSNTMLDIALGSVPFVSMYKDAYEAYTGKNLVTGEQLTSLDRSLAFVGFGLGLTSGGTLGGFGKNVIKYMAKAGPEIKQIVSNAGNLVSSARKIFGKTTSNQQVKAFGNYIKKSGDDILTSNMDDIVKQSQPYFRGWRPHYKFNKKLDADIINKEFIDRGLQAPYKSGSKVFEFTTSTPDIWVRVHNESNKARSWMMRKDAIKGMTSAQIKTKYALPETPKYISEVHVPKGTKIRKGKIGRNDFGDIEGAVQYELLDRLPNSAFRNTKEISGIIE